MHARVRLRNRDRGKRERERKDLQREASQVGNNRGEESKRDERKGRGRAARNIHLEYRRRGAAEDGMRFDQECASGEDNALPCVKRNPLGFLRLPALISLSLEAIDSAKNRRYQWKGF